ncbi:unnamed protein product [Didymodactylos carnosus]|uniref:Uncharacterized protein n=1 Tax=Didymodactylos carnosus TaxID=1234261 RepID=A0A813VBW7_9BILA|nr:unnamed protein product [Didymodactylos carnosus]CAF0841135.1 unnamed protein product [Didymodactylos carnosus]CAF3566601.1 unnamed protein product [Didymodactylos carnosus]CAF3628477.1 unnamed protein product [Didymodactylos carnosus]
MAMLTTARLPRRDSMKHLKLYDLDDFEKSSSSNNLDDEIKINSRHSSRSSPSSVNHLIYRLYRTEMLNNTDNDDHISMNTTKQVTSKQGQKTTKRLTDAHVQSENMTTNETNRSYETQEYKQKQTEKNDDNGTDLDEVHVKTDRNSLSHNSNSEEDDIGTWLEPLSNDKKEKKIDNTENQNEIKHEFV